jgi:hypothetical protein
VNSHIRSELSKDVLLDLDYQRRFVARLLQTLAIPIVQGRSFLESDKLKAPLVAIVNEQFARHYWPNKNAIGKQIPLNDALGKAVEILGVCEDVEILVDH